MESSSSASSRRTFLSMILGGLAAVFAAASAYPLWNFLKPKADDESGQQVTLKREELLYNDATFITYRGRPAVVLQTSPGQYVALSAVCTHLGCIIKWHADKGEFICPCHGGRFSTTGEVLGGPPPKALETFPVHIDGDQLIVG